MKILLIIPAYNEEKNILEVCNVIKEYNNKANLKLDYVVINDESIDDILKILQENNLNHVNLINNLGIGWAVQTGYKYAHQNDYDISFQFDGDGQHDVNYVSHLCEVLKKNEANMFIGTRYLDKNACKFQTTFMRRLGLE